MMMMKTSLLAFLLVGSATAFTNKEVKEFHADNLRKLKEHRLRAGNNKDASRQLAYGNDPSCAYNYDSIDCQFCAGEICMQETCLFGDNYDAMSCDVCVTEYDNPDYSKTCMSLSCEMETFMDSQSTTEDACTCQGATIDGNECEVCSFCKHDGVSYDFTKQIQSEQSFTRGLNLQCSDYGINTTCPVGPLQKLGIAGATLVALGIIAAVAFAYWAKKQCEDDPEKKFVIMDEDGDGVVEPKAPIS